MTNEKKAKEILTKIKNKRMVTDKEIREIILKIFPSLSEDEISEVIKAVRLQLQQLNKKIKHAQYQGLER